MILRACLSVLLLVHLSAAECACYNNQTAVPVYTPSGPRHPEDYTSCYPTGGYCLYTANTGNESLSLCNITFISFFSPTESPMRVVINDGGVNVFNLTPADVQNPDIIKKLAGFVSKTSELEITMTVSNPNDGSISLYFYNCPRPVEPSLPPTTSAPTFSTVTGVPSQPGLIGADIAFAFVAAGSDYAMFNQTTAAMSATVESLNVVQSRDNPMGVRLGLLAPSGTNKPNTFGDQWNLDMSFFTTVLGVLPKMVGGDKAQWIPALEAFLGDGGYFNPNATDDHKPRANVQKIFVFFTQTSPLETAEKLKPSLLKLKELDVHMVVVDARTTEDSLLVGLRDDPDITNFAYINSQDPNDFLYKYVLQSDNDTFYGCTYKEKTQEITSSALPVSWPQNSDPTAQYCNNQRSVLQLVSKDSTTKNLCISISSYELETEVDYLRFYDSDRKEIASFTGIDVIGSKFLIPGNQTTVTFTTNENTIYKGVQFTITAGDYTDPKTC